MDQETRFKNIVVVLKDSTEQLSASEITKRYHPSPSSSDSLTTQGILNIMSLMGYVKKIPTFKGRSVRYKYTSTIKMNYLES